MAPRVNTLSASLRLHSILNASGISHQKHRECLAVEAETLHSFQVRADSVRTKYQHLSANTLPASRFESDQNLVVVEE